MGSDEPRNDRLRPCPGDVRELHAPDAAEAKRVFKELADGGEVTQALIETFFSPAFGMCLDRFGTPWMVVADQPESGD